MLGVVGLVIGGIWVAASAVNNSLRLQETASGLLTTYKRSTELFNRTNVPNYSVCISKVGAMGITPQNWVIDPEHNCGGGIRGPFGNISFAYNYDSIHNRTTLQMILEGLTPDNCVKLINSVAGRLGNGQGLAGVYNDTYAIWVDQFPIAFGAPVCGGGINAVSFLFEIN